MSKKSLTLFLAVASIVLGTARASQAALIDFTNAANWSGASGQWLYTSSTLFDGVQVTVTSQGVGGLLTFNSGGDVNPSCAGVTGLACGGDGLGVGDDEVTLGTSLLDANLERLYVYFSAPVSVTSISFLDLFGANPGVGDPVAETAMWTVLHPGGVLEDGSLVGTDTTSNLGYGTTATNYSNVGAILFYATPPAAANTDFALASINISAVPEPATLLLVGVGLIAVSFKSRGRRHAR